MDIVKTDDTQILSYCCRICVTVCDAQYYIHDRSVDHARSLSLHSMLEKLFPTVFNPQQVEQDHNMNWPSTICLDCRCKVLNAFVLYEQCEKSVELLNQLQFIAIDDSVSFATDEADIPEKPSEEEPQLSDPNSFKMESPVKLIIVDNKPQQPQSVRSSNRTSLKNLQIIVPMIKRTKRKQTTVAIRKSNAKQRTAANNEKKRPQCEKGNRSEEKSKENLNLQLIADTETSQSSSPTVQTSKQEGVRRTEKGIDATPASQTDTDELETKIDLYQCVLCDAPTYSSPKEFTEHLKQNHPEQIRTCEHCPKVFVTQAAFEQHLYCHATGRSHFCTFCDKGFQTEQLLNNHIRTHTHRSNYLCSHCGKEFNNNSNLRQHIIGHSGHKPWACSLCPCRFSTKGGLTIHQNTHTKVKAFSCDTCGSQFNKHYSLIKHKLIHTGERPFGCEVCGMRFATSYMVKRHMRTHTGEKPFKCTYCDRSFAQSNDMVKHMKIHVGSNPYQCDRCDATFRLLTELRNHYKEHCDETGELGTGGATDHDKGIRFTSIDILQLRYKKEKGPSEGND